MPRLPYPDASTLTPVQRQSYNGALNVSKMCAHLPDDVLAGFLAFGRAVLTNNTLDPVLREMAIVRVGYLSNAPYEIHQHVQYSRKIGMAEDKLESLKTGSVASVFSAKERAVLRFVEELVLNVRPPDVALADLQQYLKVPEIFTLILTVGQYMMVSRLLETTGVELDPDGVVVDPQRS